MIDDRTKRLPVLAIVKHAAGCLRDAQFRLDDAGFQCPALNDLSSDASALVSAWEGRQKRARVTLEHSKLLRDDLPTGFAKATREYRRALGLSY